MADTLAVGSTLIVDGKAWTVAELTETKGTATRTVDERTSRIHFGLAWVVSMGEGLFTLQGRLAPSGPSDVVTEAAVASLTT